jgi:carbamate kinase
MTAQTPKPESSTARDPAAGSKRMRVVVALGGNALLLRGEPLTATNQRKNAKVAAQALAPVARRHELVISHGNGPQVGLLALQAAAYRDVEPYPLDVLGAQSEGMIGYLIEQELGNLLPVERPFATVLTMVLVDRDDPAFDHPTKPIGPVYTEDEAKHLAESRGWSVAPDTGGWRRVVPSPRPRRIFEIRPIKWLLEKGVIVICTGGGGIPTMYDQDGKSLIGVEAVIDKDLASALLAWELDADFLVMATDVAGVYEGFGTPEASLIRHITPESLRARDFAAGSMGPKVEAACRFVELSGGAAGIGALADVSRILEGEAGTVVRSVSRDTGTTARSESPGPRPGTDDGDLQRRHQPDEIA